MLLHVHGSTALHFPYVDVQFALDDEAQQADTLRMDEGSAVPSTGLLQYLCEPWRSDSLVLLLCAVTARHMLTHQDDYPMLEWQFDQEERSVLTTHVPMSCNTTYSLVSPAGICIFDGLQ